MPERLFRLYQRKKIINVNVNIVLAGLVAVLLSKYPVHWMSQAIGPGLHWLKALLAGVIDATVDIGLYFLLHWVANHWRPLKPKSDLERRAFENVGSFWKNATLVQAERYLLSPIFYIIAVGGMWALSAYTPLRESWAFVVAFSGAIIVTRIIHTVWGLSSGRFEWRSKVREEIAGEFADDAERAEPEPVEPMAEAPQGDADLDALHNRPAAGPGRRRRLEQSDLPTGPGL